MASGHSEIYETEIVEGNETESVGEGVEYVVEGGDLGGGFYDATEGEGAGYTTYAESYIDDLGTDTNGYGIDAVYSKRGSGLRYATDKLLDGDEYGAEIVYHREKKHAAPRARKLKKSVVQELSSELGMEPSSLNSESMFGLARELHEIRTEFAHAQGYSSEARTRISRLSARIKALQEHHQSQITSLRVDYEEKLKASEEREEALRNQLTSRLEAAEARADRAERDVELTMAQVQDANARVMEVELAKTAVENLLRTTEESYKVQIENLRKQIAQLNEDHQRHLAEMRSKNETLRTQVTTLNSQIRESRASQSTPERAVQETVEHTRVTRIEELKFEKESLEKQVEKLTEKHLHELEAMEDRHQALITEAVSLREENRTLLIETANYKTELDRMQKELRVLHIEKIGRRRLNVGVQVIQMDVARNVRHALTQTDRVHETECAEKVEQKQQQVIVTERLVQPQIVHVPMPFMQQQVQQQQHQDLQLRNEFLRLREEHEALQSRYAMLATDARAAQAALTQRTAVTQQQMVSHDDRLIHELQEKLFTAERARLSAMSEMQEKMTLREQEFMAKQHQLELKVITLQGEKERDLQAKEIKFQSEKGELSSLKGDLESRLDRVTKDKETLVKEYDARITKLRDEMNKLERDLDNAKMENKELARRLDTAQSQRSTLESRIETLVTERTHEVPTFSALTVQESDTRQTDQRRLYDRLQRENDGLSNDLREAQKLLRQARDQVDEYRSKEKAKTVEIEQVSQVKRRSISRSPERVTTVLVGRGRATTPVPYELETQVHEMKRRLERKDREARFLRQRAEEFERKYVRSQELVADLSRKARAADLAPKIEQERARYEKTIEALRLKLAQRESDIITLRSRPRFDDEHLARRVQVLDQQLSERRDRISKLEKELDEARMQLSLRDDSIEQLKKESRTMVHEERSSIDVTIRSQLDAKIVEADRYRQLASDLEIRLKRSQHVIQQLFAIIERSRQNNIKFSQGVMELQLRHLGAERGAEWQLLSSDRTIADMIRINEEEARSARMQIEGISATVTGGSVASSIAGDTARSLLTGDASTFDQSIQDAEVRLKREAERSSAEQAQLDSRLRELQRAVTQVTATGSVQSWSTSGAGRRDQSGASEFTIEKLKLDS